MAAETETFDFQPHISKLLSMMINRSYTDEQREVFFPGLISNSYDALERVRFERLKDKKITMDAYPDLFIRIVPDKSSNTLTIIDNGIGMTKSDLVRLGTVPTPDIKRFGVTKSDLVRLGTVPTPDIKRFGMTKSELVRLGTVPTPNIKRLMHRQIIGLGFFSYYFVAERIVVTSKHNDDEQYVWDSRGLGSFTVARDTFGENLGRGTKVTLYLKDDQRRYLEENDLKDLVKKHAEFISYQISLKTTEKDPSGSEWLVINKKPIWIRKPEEISKEEYTTYYSSRVVGQLKEFKGKKLKGLKPSIKKSEDEKDDLKLEGPNSTLTEEQKKECRELAKKGRPKITIKKVVDMEEHDCWFCRMCRTSYPSLPSDEEDGHF